MTFGDYKYKFDGPLGWLIFWIIIFFPIAILILITDGYLTKMNRTYRILKYDGSRFWLGFWFVVFFPVCIVLLLLFGDWMVEENPHIATLE